MLRSKLNSDRFSKVSLARRLFESGLSHPKASYAEKPILGLLPSGQLKLTKFAPGEFVFARPRQLLLHCSTSCIHAVEKKVTKDKSVWNRFGCEARAARVPGWHESAGRPLPLFPCAPRSCAPCGYSTRVAKRDFLSLWQRAASMQRPFGLLTRHIPVPRPLGAMHANRLSCRFVSAKAAVLGAANGIKSSMRNIRSKDRLAGSSRGSDVAS
jgi:hypothetical protein